MSATARAMATPDLSRLAHKTPDIGVGALVWGADSNVPWQVDKTFTVGILVGNPVQPIRVHIGMNDSHVQAVTNIRVAFNDALQAAVIAYSQTAPAQRAAFKAQSIATLLQPQRFYVNMHYTLYALDVTYTPAQQGDQSGSVDTFYTQLFATDPRWAPTLGANVVQPVTVLTTVPLRPQLAQWDG